jgi:hypothetical protein
MNSSRTVLHGGQVWLTKRDSEVADLIARGLTNDQIAARFIAGVLPNSALVRLRRARHMAVFERHDRLQSESPVQSDALFCAGRPPQADQPPEAIIEELRSAHAT